MTGGGIRPAVPGLDQLPSPSALQRAVEAVCRAHPYGVSGEVDAESPRAAADADVLWNRLVGLPAPEREFAVRGLRSFECRLLAATARPRLEWAEYRSVLALAMAHHALPDAAALAWEAWLAGDGGERGFCGVALPRVASAAAARDFWRSLLAASRPSDPVIALWRRQHLPLDKLVATAAVGLQQYERFVNAVRRRLLAPGNLSTLDAQEMSATIVDWVATLVPVPEQNEWYAAFLDETYGAQREASPRRGWTASHSVLVIILQRSGDPANGGPFWQLVSEPVRDAFSLWLKDRELTENLGDDNDRVRFWRRYLVPMRRSELNRDGTVALLHFDRWVAVQFVNSGRATFLFRETAARGWHRLPDADLYDRMLRLRRQVDPSFLDSYEHRGYSETWQSAAGDVVNRVIRRLNQARHGGQGR